MGKAGGHGRGGGAYTQRGMNMGMSGQWAMTVPPYYGGPPQPHRVVLNLEPVKPLHKAEKAWKPKLGGRADDSEEAIIEVLLI